MMMVIAITEKGEKKMPRYIDIGDTVKTFKKLHGEESTLLNCYNADWIVSFLESQPTADMVEVRHGHWIDEIRPMYGQIYAKWSVCELCSGVWLSNMPYKYCPHCGAKIDGKENKNEYE